jgi:hypothetical protein
MRRAVSAPLLNGRGRGAGPEIPVAGGPCSWWIRVQRCGPQLLGRAHMRIDRNRVVFIRGGWMTYYGHVQDGTIPRATVSAPTSPGRRSTTASTFHGAEPRPCVERAVVPAGPRLEPVARRAAVHLATGRSGGAHPRAKSATATTGSKQHLCPESSSAVRSTVRSSSTASRVAAPSFPRIRASPGR